ncbi:MAG: glycosyl hydrolase 115 family protein [Clostridiales bacterium]|nr:glycosyl hydrolase 115 family protein [Clostridiales bacterium]
MWLFKDGMAAPFFVEEEAYEGIKRVAEKVAEDVRQVSGSKPRIFSQVEKKGNGVVFATLGKSRFLEELEKAGKIDTGEITGKRESYAVRLIEREDGEELLLIYGSDKRGTIYGMFHLSEQIGVSPLHFWGDAVPVKREAMKVSKAIETVSKEPSVKYRGFFINDEWPCFGKWTHEQHGGFTAEMYDKVFELLLRLKGNYLWPAMWTSSFALDGPGEASAKLADIYGVVMGNSHHEPCLRAGEEWDIYRGKDSIYGNEWNYVTNREGLLRYWRDGLKRSGKYENVITVGMRGERDSIMDGPKSFGENIEILKDIITKQKELIAEYGTYDGKMPPMMLAIYKEIEHYFYGNKENAGLKEWEGLEDVILMFCEDNFGHMRYLPDPAKKHPAGYGMYFHLDYHGAPISYEWINSTPLSAIWEQMTLAYEYGIREVWMVNAGDLKGNEYPLSYFMELAYDYDSWGSSAPGKVRDYTREWIGRQFNDAVTKEQSERLAEVLFDGTALISRHRPEALDSKTYHPIHEREADRVLKEVKKLTEQLISLEQELGKEALPAFYSMIYDDLMMGFNLICMQIYAGKNEHYARQGKPVANLYAKKVEECIEEDSRLIFAAVERFNGKWREMRTGSHIGFCKWNEDGCRYPLRMYVEPFYRPRLAVSRADGERILQKNYGVCDSMDIFDFMENDTTQVEIEIANTGIDSLCCEIQMEECEWLNWQLTNHKVEYQEILTLSCVQGKMPEEEQICVIRITDGDTIVELRIHGKKKCREQLPVRTFLPQKEMFSILAKHYAKSFSVEGEERAHLITMEDFGLCGSGIKCAPFSYRAQMPYDIPYAVYRVLAEEEGEYTLELWTAPSNPIMPQNGQALLVKNQTNETEWHKVELLPEDYQAGEPDCFVWAEGVVRQIHKKKTSVFLEKRVNEIAIGFLDGNVVLEKILVYPKGIMPKESCMGPEESHIFS